MDHDIQHLLEEAMKLPAEARAALADTLLQSLDETMDDGVREAWDVEIAKRIKDFNEGKQKAMPWSEARKRIERRIRSAR